MPLTRSPAAQTRIAIDQSILDKIDEIRPQYMDRTTFINFQLDSSIKLAEPRGPQGATDPEGRSPFNSSLNRRNKENDFSLRAEEAHVSEETIKSPPRQTKDVPGNLLAHDDLIRIYWKAKPKNKTVPAWKLLMTELTKIQDDYGDIAVRSQLKLAEANRWQGITLANYERFGLSQSGTPKQGSSVDWEAIDKMGPMF